MYPDLRRLGRDLAAEPFATLAVMGDHDVSTVIQDTEKGTIRWRTWFDGDAGPVATAWNIQRWPTLYLIDHQGVIADRRPLRTYQALRTAIDPLLAAERADPAAGELLKAHPLPELPILKAASEPSKN
jgi:hypothetical protein